MVRKLLLYERTEYRVCGYALRLEIRVHKQKYTNKSTCTLKMVSPGLHACGPCNVIFKLCLH